MVEGGGGSEPQPRPPGYTDLVFNNRSVKKVLFFADTARGHTGNHAYISRCILLYATKRDIVTNRVRLLKRYDTDVRAPLYTHHVIRLGLASGTEQG